MKEGKERSSWVWLILAVSIAWAFLALTLWQVVDYGAPAGHPVRQQLMAAVASDARLKIDIAQFFAAYLLIHTILGAAIWFLACAVRRAYPGGWSMLPTISGWSALILGTIYTLNAALFQWSTFASIHGLVTAPLFASVTFADVLSTFTIGLIFLVLVRAALTFQFVRSHAVRIAAYGVLGTAAIATVHALELRPLDRLVSASKPNVILIGIDSLRPDTVGRGKGIGVTPHIDRFLEEAVMFTDTTTPLARTFSSWTTILSGQHPVRSGARDNLMPRDALTPFVSLADRMRSVGYKTVYATDEVRFSNIDTSFGFDRVIGPKMGPSDFMLGRWGDQPLLNLLANTRVARVLFPNVYGNRAVAATYRPAEFINWVEQEVSFDGPTFLAMHLTLPHYPYHWANDHSIFPEAADGSYRYLAGVVGADEQFGQLLQVLERRGALGNAIVVLLSDHGEALGLNSDNLLSDRSAKAAVGKLLVSMTGHGSSVLSPTQYQVVLAIRQFGLASSGAVATGLMTRSAPASLEDVAPTVLSLAGIGFEPFDFDGHSLVAEIERPGADPALTSRVRFTETGLTTTFMRMGDFSESANVEEGMKFFDIDPAASRVIFRRDRFADLLEQKERAAITSDMVLAAIPDPERGVPKYVFVSRAGGVPRIVTSAPETVTDPEFAVLWEQLKQRFGPEVTPSAR